MKNNIYLIGFMGTGKSTVSRSLAELLGYEEIDTDAWIVRQQNRSIPEIFETQGEEYFRELETDLLRRMKSQQHKIISCGGGMVLREENTALMKETGVVVLLTATPQTILSRVENGADRPILNGNMNVEYIRGLMEKRAPYYEAAGEVVIVTDHRLPEEIAEEIKKKLEFDKISFDF